MFLVHYFDNDFGPFNNISSLSINEAKIFHEKVLMNRDCFAAKRQETYYTRRKELENIAYNIFKSKGGNPKINYPHYFVLEECKWLEIWFKNPNFIKIKISEINIDELSFCYGDMFPTFSENINDKKEYRKNIYTFDEIKEIIKRYGLPQEWNENGEYGPERYVEAHYWNNNIEKIIKNGIYKIRAYCT